MIWATLIGICALFAACVFAWAKGGPAERAGAVVLAVTWVSSDYLWMGAQHLHLLDSQQLKILGSLGADFILATGFLILAVRYSSLWLGGVMLVQGLELGLHAMFLGEEPTSKYTYVFISNVFSYLVLFGILLGTLAYWRKARASAKTADRGEHHIVAEAPTMSPSVVA